MKFFKLNDQAMSGSRKLCQSGSNSDKVFLGERGSKNTKSGQLSACQRNAFENGLSLADG